MPVVAQRPNPYRARMDLATPYDRLRDFVHLNPEFEVPVERLASWLARADDEPD